jgi:hypothetical protein
MTIEGEGLSYPCNVVNLFECPYGKNKEVDNDTSFNIEDSFTLAEMAFTAELAPAKAMKEDSIIQIRTTKDIYNALRDKTLWIKYWNKD